MTGILAAGAALTDFGAMEPLFAKADAAAVRRKLGFGMMRLPMMEAANPAHVVPANRKRGKPSPRGGSQAEHTALFSH